MRFLTDLAGDMPADAREGFGRLVRAGTEAAERDGEVTVSDVSTAVRPLMWLLQQVRGGGVTLTQAGYLPPALVTTTMQELGWHDRRIGKMNREDQTLPVLWLRAEATELGLLRKYRGVLLPTRLGARMTGEPELLWDHLADRLLAQLGEGPLRASTLLLLLGVATRQYSSRDAYLTMVANGLQNLGWVTPEHRRLSVPAVAAIVDGPIGYSTPSGHFRPTSTPTSGGAPGRKSERRSPGER